MDFGPTYSIVLTHCGQRLASIDWDDRDPQVTFDKQPRGQLLEGSATGDAILNIVCDRCRADVVISAVSARWLMDQLITAARDGRAPHTQEVDAVFASNLRAGDA